MYLKCFICFALWICLIVVEKVGAQESVENDADAQLQEKINRSIHRACQYLAKQQGNDGALRSGYPVAATALAGLAWLAIGSTPDEGLYASNIKRALRYLLKCQQRSGFISEPGNGSSGMYGHGYSSQFFSQVCGMIRDEGLASELERGLNLAVRLIEGCQNSYGGWNSTPVAANNDDGSGAVAIMQITALRAAESAGVRIRTQVIEKARKYLLGMTNDEGWYGYNWHARSSGQGSAANTGAGMYMYGALNMQYEEKYRKGIKNLMNSNPFLKGGQAGSHFHSGWYEYTVFYSSLAIYQHGGEEWRRWYPAMAAALMRTQQADGGWNESYGGVFTALATLSLELPLRYLPMFLEGGAGLEGK